ncbi:MAG: carboxypeptidase-like regulatory domain-containing protein [bacterium]
MRKLLAVLALATVAFAASQPCTDGCTLLGTASISGTITDSVTGLPVDSAKVTAGRCGGRSAWTDADGNYTIADLAAGSYAVKAMKCGEYVMKSYPTPVRVEEGQAVTGIDIALSPMQGGGGGDGSISGIVYDKSTNLPVVDAKVFLNCHYYVMTNELGEYTLGDLADGSYRPKAAKEGYACSMWPELIVISGGNAVTGIDFLLVPRLIQALD